MQEQVASTMAEERIGQLCGDRLCVKCGYNLSGQHIVRESHYNMLIVRCPECGTVASVQEYPLLGRWAGRWAVVLAALWALCVLMLLTVPPIPLVGGSFALAYASVNPAVDALGDAQEAWAAELEVEVETPSWDWVSTSATRHSRYTRLHREFWEDFDRAAFFAEHGGWMRLVDWRMMRQWTIAGFAMTALGIVWSLALPHVRRRWLPLAGAVMFGVCAAYWLVASDMWSPWLPSDLEDAAMELIGPRVALAFLVVACVSFVVGLLIGRSVMRLAIRALLPPRLRGSLALLWTIDGLDLPAARTGARRG